MRADVFVIGGGPAGLSAATAAAEAGAGVVLAEPFSAGGRLLTHIECDASDGSLTGPEYASKLVARAIGTGRVRMIRTAVVRVGRDLTVETAGGEGSYVCSAGAVVLASGGKDVPFSAIGASFTAGVRGICSVSDALAMHCLFGRRTGRRAVIIGAGEDGLTAARRLTLEGTTVAGVTEISPSPRASSVTVRDCIEDIRVPLYTSARVISVNGIKNAESVRVESQGEEFILRCDAVICAAGRLPCASLLPFASLTKAGVLSVDSDFMTDSAGIFAAGGALHHGNSFVLSAEEGRAAGRAAAAYALGSAPERQTRSLFAAKGVKYVLPSRVPSEEECVVTIRPTEDIRSGKIVIRGESGRELYSSDPVTMSTGRETSVTIPAKAVTENADVSAEAL